MCAGSARALHGPFIGRLVGETTGLHPVILASTRGIEKIHRRIEIAGSSKQVEPLRLLANERKSTNVARRAERKEIRRNGRSAKEHVLVGAVLKSKCPAAQLYGIGVCQRCNVTLRAVVGEAHQVIQQAHVQTRAAISDAAMTDIERVAAGKIIVLNLCVNEEAPLAAGGLGPVEIADHCGSGLAAAVGNLSRRNEHT